MNPSPTLGLPPTHYTDHEGGEWIAWPSTVTFDMRLLYCHSPLVEAIKYKGLTIHSMKWADGRWDCQNGRTAPIGTP